MALKVEFKGKSMFGVVPVVTETIPFRKVWHCPTVKFHVSIRIDYFVYIKKNRNHVILFFG